MANPQTVTVLFTDMVGSTALSSSLDPAGADVLRREHFSVLRQALAAAEGTEVKNLGDGIMAVFGSSSAAIACSVAMQQGVDDYNRRSRHALGLRIGLSGGEVTVEEGDYFGDPVVEAARVCALCEGGQILLTDAVRFMVGRRSSHQLEPLGERELKGLPEQVALFDVKWEPTKSATSGIPLPDRLDARTAPQFGYFGREREQMQLVDALKQAMGGTRQVALVAGEPGIGKSSLCRQVAQRAHELDVCVLYGRCDEDLGLSYQPVAEALSHLVVHADDELLAQHVATFGPVLAGLAPALSTRLPEVPPARSAEPDAERARLYRAVVGLLAAASSDCGLLMVVDDLHWADTATLQILRHLAGSTLLPKVMILATYRDSELAAGSALSDLLASLRREGDVQRVDLAGLDDVATIEMMESAAGHPMRDDGVALAHAVRRETEGNPFFTTEMLVHLGESGLVRQDEGRWVAAEELQERGLPQSVREVVGQRVDRLGEETRRVLAQASVIGRDFDVELLAAVADVDEDHLLDLLDEASAAGLVTEVEGVIDRYSFSHALTQHALYDDLGSSRRARLHRAVAEALEALSGSAIEARAGELAHHYTAATRTADAAKALTYLRMAGDQALEQLAPADALAWFRRALELADQSDADETLRCDLLIGLGTAERQTGDPAHRVTLLRAAAVASDLRDRDRLVRAALANHSGGAGADAGHVDDERVAVLEEALEVVGGGDSVDRALLLAILCNEFSYSPDTQRMANLAAEALTMARRLDDPVTFLRVANAVYVSAATPDNLDVRLADLDDAVSIAASIGDPSAGYHAHYTRAVACSQAGDRAAFDAHVAACEGLAEELDQPYERWSFGCLRSAQTLLSGDLETSEAQAEAVLAIGIESAPEALSVYGGQLMELRRQQGRLAEIVDGFEQAVVDNPGLPVLRAAIARAYCDLDRTDDARSLVRADIADGFREFRYDFTWLLSMVILAEVCSALEDADGARVLYERLLPWQDQVASVGPSSLGPVRLYLGMLARVLEDFDRSDAHLEAAVRAGEGLGAPYWVAMAQFERAAMLLRRDGPGDEPRARAMLDSALGAARRFRFEKLEARVGSMQTATG